MIVPTFQARPPRILPVALAVVASIGFAQLSAAQEPRFKSSVDLTSIDVAVVDARGQPIRDLTPGDFAVRIDGKPREVTTADWVPLGSTSAHPDPDPNAAEDYTSNEQASGGRLIVIAVDEPHIRPGAAAAVLLAASAFIERLAPADRIAAVSLGQTGLATPFTSDRRRLSDALGRMGGQWERVTTGVVTISSAEALEIEGGSRIALDQVVTRECSGLRGLPMLQCRQEIQVEASASSQQIRRENQMSAANLRALLLGLGSFEGPKTLVLISEGFPYTDGAALTELGALAATVRTSIYALRLANQFFDAANVRSTAGGRPLSGGRDDGLEALTDAARGTHFTVTNTGNELFRQIQSELSGYYLLSIESDPGDRDGRPRSIRVEVSRHGATVRARRQLLNVPADLNRPRTPHDTVAATLSAPVLSSALPIRMATFSLRGADAAKVQVLIRAEIGGEYIRPTQVWLAYFIQDRDGRIVDSGTVNPTLAPSMVGVPGSLLYTGAASLSPGEYSLKLAVVEGDRVGSVEHPVHAALLEVGDVTLSELLVGGPADARDPMRPAVGHTASFGLVQAYLEAYGIRASEMSTTYEIAANVASPALAVIGVPTRRVGAERVLFSQMMAVGRLPPGEYVLRALIRSKGVLLKTLSRRFAVAVAPVLMTSAAGVDRPASIDMFLPLEERAVIRPFARAAALDQQTLEQLREHVPDRSREAFDEGRGFLAAGNDVAAETAFRQAASLDADNVSALAYLGAALASAGRDVEAVTAWQSALAADRSDVPELSEWLGEALLRTHDFSGARSVLEDAFARWPSDSRFARPLAAAYATLGSGREAVRMLDRYIADHHLDPELMALVIEWIFEAHVNRTVVTNAEQDVELARRYAASYANTDGTHQEIVRQWLAYIEREPR